MKKSLITFIPVLLVVTFVGLFSAFKKAEQQVGDIFNTLGISKEEGIGYIKSNILSGGLGFPSSSKYKKIAMADRAQIVRDLGDYIKKYTQSAAFAETYRKQREEMMPQLDKGMDVKEKIEETKNDIKQMEQDKKAASADMKPLFDENIKVLKEMLVALQDPNHPDHAMYTGQSEELDQARQDEYQQKMEEFNKTYPKDPQQLIKIRLKEFLANTNDIDFNAKLVKKDNRMKFVNPEYEAKDSEWKRCYRAGKETIETARNFAQQWLNEIK